MTAFLAVRADVNLGSMTKKRSSEILSDIVGGFARAAFNHAKPLMLEASVNSYSVKDAR